MDFFFFKKKTAYEVRISDWSSDVCSSDLVTLDDVGQIAEVLLPSRLVETELMHQLGMAFRGYAALAGQESHRIARQQPDKGEGHQGDAEEIGRASCRERVCQYV